MALPQVTDPHETILVGDLRAGDLIEVGGFRERVERVSSLGSGYMLVRTDATVLVREHTTRMEVAR